MIVSYEGLAAEVVVIEVPQFDGEIGGAGGEVSALLVEGDVVDGV